MDPGEDELAGQSSPPQPNSAEATKAALPTPTPAQGEPILVEPARPTDSSDVNTQQQWFYVADGGPHGPVTPEVLRGKLHAGELGPATQVRKVGATDWSPLHAVPELVARDASPNGLTPAVVTDFSSLGGDKEEGRTSLSKEVALSLPEEPTRRKQIREKGFFHKLSAFDKDITSGLERIRPWLFMILGVVFIALAPWDVSRILSRSMEFTGIFKGEYAPGATANAAQATANTIQALNLNTLWIGQLIAALLCFAIAEIMKLRLQRQPAERK